MMQVMFNVISAGVRPEIPDNMSPSYRALMESCWQTEAEARCRKHAHCNMRMVLEHCPCLDVMSRQTHLCVHGSCQ